MATDWKRLRQITLAGFTGDPDWAGTQTTPVGDALVMGDLDKAAQIEIVPTDGAGVPVPRGTLDMALTPIIGRITEDPAVGKRTFYSEGDDLQVSSVLTYKALVEDEIGGKESLYVRIKSVAGAPDGSAIYLEVWARGRREL